LIEKSNMRVTVCELPHEPAALEAAWAELCRHTKDHASELVLLPELAMVAPVWEREHFDPGVWAKAEELGNCWLDRLEDLRARHVVSTRLVSSEGGHYNEGFIWSAGAGVMPLRRKCFLPDETSLWEAQWFDRGDEAFPIFRAGELTFGLNICTELWALETYAEYATRGVQIILSPRATEAATMGKWLSVGVVAAVRSGAYSISSNRVDAEGTCGGMGWIVSPDGEILAVTTPKAPFATVDVDLTAAARARKRYPCYVFGGEMG
jgi:N-carbamoylputrescine amidase